MKGQKEFIDISDYWINKIRYIESHFNVKWPKKSKKKSI